MEYEFKEFTAKTSEEAIELGLKELALKKEEAVIVVLEEGKKRLTLDVKKNNIIGYNLYMQEGFREY